MDIKVNRFSSGKEDTLGTLSIDNKFFAFTLEDEARTKKVMGETRIPAGRYEIKLRTEGGFHNRYLNKFGSNFHKGMLHLQDVPNFTWVLIHIGNDDDDTAGCLLVGDSSFSNVEEPGKIGSSTNAYKRLYPVIASALEAGESVHITIQDND